MKTLSLRVIVPSLLVGFAVLMAGDGVLPSIAQEPGATPVTSAVDESGATESDTDAASAEAPSDATSEAAASTEEAGEPSGTDETASQTGDDPAASTDSGSPQAAAGGGATGTAGGTTEAAKAGGMSGYFLALVVVLLFVVPILLGNFFAGKLKMPDHGWKISVALGTLAAAAVILRLGELRGGPDLVGGIILVYELEDASELIDPTKTGPSSDDGDAEKKRGFRMDDMITALTKRVNPGGNKEVTIRKYGADQIEIIIPKAGEEELDQIKEELTTLGELEFRITVDRQHPEDAPLIRAAEALSPFQKEVVVDGRTARWIAYSVEQLGPPDKADPRIIPRVGKDRASQDVPEALILIDPYDVTGKFLLRAYPGADDAGRPAVHFTFNTPGASRFSRLTGANLPDSATGVKRNLGIVLNRTLERAPSINSKISDRGIIEGYDNQQEVEKIVNILNAGSLPAALNPIPISEEKISPTLGAETIEKGKVAITISLSGVLIFMLVYYHFCGFVACLALAANLLLIVGAMVMVQAAFTLPGLAGLVLTVGMSVDANVLIFERIREELSHGAALRMAIRNGFGRATRTIVDANLTTLITGVVLFWIGTDQIKGFAVTLILGIIMSMFTAIFCSRIIFDIAERRRWITELKMLRIIGNTHYNFLNKEKIAVAFSGTVIVIGLIAAFTRGAGLFNIDFTGGASVTMVLKEEEKMSQGEVRSLLAATDLGKRNLSVVERGTEGTRFTINARFEETGTDAVEPVEQVQQIIQKVFEGKLETHSVKVTATQTVASQRPAPRRDVEQASARPTPTIGSASEDSIVIEYDPTGQTLTPVSFLQDDGGESDSSGEAEEAEGADSDATPEASAAAETDDRATTDGESTPPQEGAQPNTEAASQPDDAGQAEETTTGTEPSGDSPASDADRLVEKTQATLTFGEPVGFDTVARSMDQMLSEHTEREVVFSLANPAYTPGTAARFEVWDVRLELPVAEATPLLKKFETQLNAEPLFPLSNRIGSRVADKMKQLATLAILFSLVCIVGYIWLRFQHVVFGLAAVVALVHDVLVTLGMIAVSAYLVEFAAPLAGVLRVEPFQISLPIVAAFLTIIGYSLNDTIVVFDRIREVRGKSPDLTGDMINTSINQTLSRTLLTSLTTLIVVIILYFVGGAGIHGFAFALVVGVLVGTYSSIFVASPVLLWMSTPRKKPAAA